MGKVCTSPKELYVGFGMPSHDSCCAPGCQNWRGKSGCAGIRFYRIPRDKSVRLTWLARINRADLRLKDVTENTRLCSAHFHNGAKTNEQPLPVKFKHKTYPVCRRRVARQKGRSTSLSSVRAPSKRKPIISTIPVSSSSEAREEDRVVASSDCACYSGVTEDPQPQTGAVGIPAQAPTNCGTTGIDLEADRCSLDLSSSPCTDSSAAHSSGCAELERVKLENMYLRMQIERQAKQIEKLTSPGLELVLCSDEMLAYYTGLPSKRVFTSLLCLIEKHMGLLYSPSGHPRGPSRQLRPGEEFLMLLMRLRLALPERDLQFRFQLRDSSRVSKILSAWLPFLAKVLPPLMPWPRKSTVKKNMPQPFKTNSSYCRVRAILDCAEFEMEAPSALSLNAMTYSDYKGRNTVKVLFVVTPDGYISFVSSAYPGSISDNAITLKSGLLDRMDPGDEIMADKGFTLSNTELQPRGIKLVLPPFRYGGSQFTAAEVETTKKNRKFANCRGKLYYENTVLPYSSSSFACKQHKLSIRYSACVCYPYQPSSFYSLTGGVCCTVRMFCLTH